MQLKEHLVLMAVTVYLYAGTANAQVTIRKTSPPQPNVEYDARDFLSTTERNIFRRMYPQFDDPIAEKNWQWKDVDPLGLFSVEENRRRRREEFLFEYSPLAELREDSPTNEQRAFSVVIQKQIAGTQVLLGRNTLKLIMPYTARYDGKLPQRSLLERTAQLGLQWAQVGGTKLYVYNGPILMARYKVGYVSVANRNIDQPFKRLRQNP